MNTSSRKLPAAAELRFAEQVMSLLGPREPDMVRTLLELVEMESPSHNKTAVDRFGNRVAAELERLGGRVSFDRQSESGDHLRVDFPSKDGPGRLLLLGHLDTVWEIGTLASMPCRVKDGRVWGPGAFDMKSGIVMLIYALAALQEVRGVVPRPLTVLLNSDEEVGSLTSCNLIEEAARGAAAVLVLEPAAGPRGALKTARKGVAHYTLNVTGKAAHAGLDFQNGESAILELARQVTTISKFTNHKKGLTVNVGVVRGGTRNNVVAAEASAEIDVRIPKRGDAAAIEKRFRSLKPFNPTCKLTISGGVNRPPMERSKSVVALYFKARQIANSLGWKLSESIVGGGSDGSFTAALGIPTLDGLGGVGEGAHAINESVLIREMPRRAALLAALLVSI